MTNLGPTSGRLLLRRDQVDRRGVQRHHPAPDAVRGALWRTRLGPRSSVALAGHCCVPTNQPTMPSPVSAPQPSQPATKKTPKNNNSQPANQPTACDLRCSASWRLRRMRCFSRRCPRSPADRCGWPVIHATSCPDDGVPGRRRRPTRRRRRPRSPNTSASTRTRPTIARGRRRRARRRGASWPIRA